MLRRTTIAALFAAAPAMAQVPLKDVAEIREGIIATGMAYELSEECGALSARTFRGLAFLNGLQNRARELGYTRAQIDAYIDDDAEKDRLEAIARARLAELGVVEGREATYCAVGRAEIAKGSQIGRLLR